MSNCCNNENKQAKASTPSCHSDKKKIDYLLWSSIIIVVVTYFHVLLFEHTTDFSSHYQTISHSIYELMNTIWIGILLGIIMVGLLSKIPREFVMSILGTEKGITGILRATFAGIFLDLCSHGILMVGSKLYERGASIGQVMAFLLASPWNSFSLTLVLITLIGLGWTAAFIILSMLVAVITGLLFDGMVNRGIIPENPAHSTLPEGFHFFSEAKRQLSDTKFNLLFFTSLLKDGIKDSRMVLRWILFGVILASLVRAFMTQDQFGTYFGATLSGLGLTILAATIIEVCSEGSTPIAADLLTRANAPGNGFAFLMTGVATDYTEVMVVKETTHSWKTALLMPVMTVPQVVVIAWLLNQTTL